MRKRLRRFADEFRSLGFGGKCRAVLFMAIYGLMVLVLVPLSWGLYLWLTALFMGFFVDPWAYIAGAVRRLWFVIFGR